MLFTKRCVRPGTCQSLMNPEFSVVRDVGPKAVWLLLRNGEVGGEKFGRHLFSAGQHLDLVRVRLRHGELRAKDNLSEPYRPQESGIWVVRRLDPRELHLQCRRAYYSPRTQDYSRGSPWRSGVSPLGMCESWQHLDWGSRNTLFGNLVHSGRYLPMGCRGLQDLRRLDGLATGGQGKTKGTGWEDGWRAVAVGM